MDLMLKDLNLATDAGKIAGIVTSSSHHRDIIRLSSSSGDHHQGAVPHNVQAWDGEQRLLLRLLITVKLG